jgi:hypothetical protein
VAFSRSGLIFFEDDAAHADFNAGIALIPEVGEGWINRGADCYASS